MGVKEVIVHEAAIREWSERDEPPLPLQDILRVLANLEEKKRSTPSDDLIIVEESPNTGFTSLPDLVGEGNEVRLSGARAGYCLRLARQVLEGRGIKVTLDSQSSLP